MEKLITVDHRDASIDGDLLDNDDDGLETDVRELDQIILSNCPPADPQRAAFLKREISLDLSDDFSDRKRLLPEYFTVEDRARMQDLSGDNDCEL